MRALIFRPCLTVITTCLIGLLAGEQAHAQDWSRFRGPDGQGVGQVDNLPDSWTEANYNWKVELPAAGHSSPVLWQGRIYLAGGNDKTGERSFMCLNAEDGSLLWSKTYASQTYKMHAFNSYGSGTAAVDDAGVYFCWTTPEQFTAVCLTHDGEERWKRNLGPYVTQHGGGISPIVHSGRVLVFVDTDREGGSGSFLTALDSKSGETIWKTTHESSLANYSVPLIYQPKPDQPPQIVLNSMGQGITSYDLEDGKQLWGLKTVAGEPLLDLRSVSSPYVAGELVIASCGTGGGGSSLVAVKPPASPGETAEMAYRITRAVPYVPTTVAKNGMLFSFTDRGLATCLDVASGELHWRQRLGGRFFCSPICSDNRILCISTSGEVIVLAADKEFKELARNDLGETCHATPAISGGRLYIRTVRHLYSLGGTPNQ
ncbi:MAG: PQQ-binding-like beta-propeller repeat protein [Pirellulales bacterium]|nr:PQQ-binding-like beta-propeller repeat protein [Pirellulales bacterium]